MRTADKGAVIHKLIRAKFTLEVGDVVISLVDMAPNAGRNTQRLPASAYHRGLIAGLSFDANDPNYPECPYDRRALANFARGANDPRAAWREGSLDGIRIRHLVLRPEATHPIPGLQHREYKALTPAMRQGCDEASMRLARSVEVIEASREAK